MKKVIVLIIALAGFHTTLVAQDKSDGKSKNFTGSLMAENCTFETTGRNSCFILEPGYRLTLRGIKGKDTTLLVVSVLNETRNVDGVETRVVEENESKNGKQVEISRNFFAFCKQTSSIYYFGEDVDMYKDGKVTSHDGAWIAGGKNKPGVMMPGLILLGSRFYQEIAPGVAMDRSEIISMDETVKTPAGEFKGCVKMKETTPLEPLHKEYKIYAPGIGLVSDGELMLIEHGFVK